MNKYISIGKIINFFGIKGEAKIGYSNESRIKNAKKIVLLDNPEKIELTVQRVKFQKNFAIMKFKEIDDINGIIPYKGQRIFVSEQEVLNTLEKDEYLIRDLIGCEVFDVEDNKIGVVVDISQNSAQDILNIKNLLGKVDFVPFVNEFFPKVDVKNKKITIKPIEGLLS